MIHDPASFQQVFNGVTGTFNWLYVDRDHIAYIHSGLYPQRAAGHDPDLPVWGNGAYEWKADSDTLNGSANASAGYFDSHGGDVERFHCAGGHCRTVGGTAVVRSCDRVVAAEWTDERWKCGKRVADA